MMVPVGYRTTFMLMPKTTPRTQRFDLPGFLLLTIGMAVLTLALDGSKAWNFAADIGGLAAGGAAAILLYSSMPKNSRRVIQPAIVPHAHVFTGVAGQFCRAYRQRYAAVYDASVFTNWSWFSPFHAGFDDDPHGALERHREWLWMWCRWLTVLAIVGFWWRPRSDWHWLQLLFYVGLSRRYYLLPLVLLLQGMVNSARFSSASGYLNASPSRYAGQQRQLAISMIMRLDEYRRHYCRNAAGYVWPAASG